MIFKLSQSCDVVFNLFILTFLMSSFYFKAMKKWGKKCCKSAKKKEKSTWNSLLEVSFWTYRRSAAACESSSWSGPWRVSGRPWSCSTAGRNPEASPSTTQTPRLLPPAGDQMVNVTSNPVRDRWIQEKPFFLRVRH